MDARTIHLEKLILKLMYAHVTSSFYCIQLKVDNDFTENDQVTHTKLYNAR